MKRFNLWEGLDFKKYNQNSYYRILQEYADGLEEKIGDVLDTKLKSYNLGKNKRQNYGLATDFNIICPDLDGYTYTLFTVYSKPEKDYPIAIDCSAFNEEEVLLNDVFNYVCENENDFIEALKEISNNKKIQQIIISLYDKNTRVYNSAE